MSKYISSFYLSLVKGLEEFAILANDASGDWLLSLPEKMKQSLSSQIGSLNQTHIKDYLSNDTLVEAFKKADAIAGLTIKKENPTGVLQSVFGLIGNDPEPLERRPLSYTQKELIKASDSVQNNRLKIQEAWKAFLEACSKCTTDNDLDSINQMLSALKFYASFIGSTTQGVSLYESVRLRSAVFASLQESEELQLICADISGIQKFIYDISSRQASRGLRGRSFYLQMLTKDIALKLTETAGVSEANIVYSSGGKFFLLASSNQLSSKQLEEIQFEVDDFLWTKFKGTLSVHLASLNFKQGATTAFVFEEKEGSISDLWRELLQKVARKKARKFEQVVVSNFNELFEPFGAGGSEKICAVSGLEVVNPIKLKTGQDESVLVSAEVFQQNEWGKELVGHLGICLGNKEEHKPGNELPFHSVKIVQKKDAINKGTIFYKTLRPQEKPDSGGLWTCFGGVEVALNKEAPKTFEELVIGGNFEKLGVLRMDVDHLGHLFSGAIPDAFKSMAHYASISAQLEWFFSHWLNVIRDRDYYKHELNIIYSGGDDLFVVGAWDKTIAFAKDVKNDFALWVKGSKLSISGGLEICGPKFPIAKAAEASGEAEENAKTYREDKNAFCFLDTVIGWDKEFDRVEEWKSKLVTWYSKKKISMGLLMKFFKLYEQFERNKRNKKTAEANLSYKWNIAYALGRLAAEKKDTEDLLVFAELQKLWFTEIENDFPFRQFILACRWAELEIRNTKTTS